MGDTMLLVDRERLVKTFLDLLAIDSPGGEEAEAARFVADCLRRMGFEPSIDSAGNVLTRCEGDGEPLLLNAHLDNVPPCRGVRAVVEGDLVRSDGSTVLGADDKAGVAAILEALNVLRERELSHPPLELAFTVREEGGHFGAKELDFRWFQARSGIVVDHGQPITRVVTRAPGRIVFEAAVHGLAAHAGERPEKGVDAIRVVCEAVANMPLGRIDQETTANIGTIGGGRADNIVPDFCRLKGEARSLSPDKLEGQKNRMVGALQTAAERYGARLDLTVTHSYHDFSVSPEAAVLQRVLDAGRRIGLGLELAATGGGSDANEFNHHGITCIVLGPGFVDPHTTSERIHLSDLVTCTALLVEAVTG